MHLITKELIDAFSKQGDTSNKSADQVMIIAKFFTPDAQCSWFVTDWIPEDDVFFGFCSLGDPDCAELGYVSKTELENLRGHLGLPVERDLHFGEHTLQEVIDKRGML